MFIQTEATHDPSQLKFLPGREVLAAGTLDLRNKTEAARSALAMRLFAIEGVTGVSLAKDSILVTKSGGDWRHLKPAILGAIAEHFLPRAHSLHESIPDRDRPSSFPHATDEDDGLESIREALRKVIDPELGYNIVDLGLVYQVEKEEGGIVRITMTTTTPGCPATNYLREGAGKSVRAIPGVEFVEVRLTYDPRWTPEMMSPEAKAHFQI